MGFAVAEHGLQSTGSVLVMHEISCSFAWGIFLDQGLNLCLLHWQEDFFTTQPPGKPLEFLNENLSVIPELV